MRYQLTDDGAYFLDRGAYTGALEVSTFEDGTTEGWDFFEYPSDRWEVNSDAALGGSSLGLWMTDGIFLETVAHPSKSETLPNYPEPGLEMRFRFRYHDIGSNPQWRFNFGFDNPDADPNKYELQFLDGTFRLQRNDGSGKADVGDLYDYDAPSWNVGDEYAVHLKWDTADISTDFDIECLNVDTDSTHSHISGDDNLGSMFTGSGVEVWKNQYQGIHFDEFYLQP